MSVYKRLTERTKNGGVRYESFNYIKTCYPQNENCLTSVDRIAIRLAELEDKLENGTLVELPCKEGDTIYELIYTKEDPCSWCEHDHSGFGDIICDLDYNHFPTVEEMLKGKKICPQFKMDIYEGKFDLKFYHYNKYLFNTTWFLTKAEAEAKLEELKKG